MKVRDMASMLAAYPDQELEIRSLSVYTDRVDFYAGDYMNTLPTWEPPKPTRGRWARMANYTRLTFNLWKALVKS